MIILVFHGVSAQNFSEHIAPIIYKHCSNCHRPGEIAPFSLTNYQEVKNWAFSIKFATSIKYMPPWKPDPTYQNFQHEKYLTDDQISAIGKWVDAGMPQGDPAKEPPFPNFPKGSQIGTPDLVVSLAQSYTHKGNGRDEYRYFVLPTNLTEDKDLIALEMRPGNNKVVHHTLFWARKHATRRARGLPRYVIDARIAALREAALVRDRRLVEAPDARKRRELALARGAEHVLPGGVGVDAVLDRVGAKLVGYTELGDRRLLGAGLLFAAGGLVELVHG